MRCANQELCRSGVNENRKVLSSSVAPIGSSLSARFREAISLRGRGKSKPVVVDRRIEPSTLNSLQQ